MTTHTYASLLSKTRHCSLGCSLSKRLVPLQEGTKRAFLLFKTNHLMAITMTGDALTLVHPGGSHDSNYCGRVAAALSGLTTYIYQPANEIFYINQPGYINNFKKFLFLQVLYFINFKIVEGCAALLQMFILRLR